MSPPAAHTPSCHTLVLIGDHSDVGEARRKISTLVRRAGFDSTAIGLVALAVTELATNIVKHARQGRVLARVVRDDSVAGVELIAMDRGPGISNLAESMRDGHSTAGTPGGGLGALTRLSPNLEIFTQPGNGTVLRLEIWPVARRETRPALEVGALCVPFVGEQESGDDWLLVEGGTAARGRHTLLVVDGLGHGAQAAVPARLATEVCAAHPAASPIEIIQLLHGTLRSTRGAAAAVVQLDTVAEVGTFCGVGNISCAVVNDGKSRSLVSHNGTLGHAMRQSQEFAFPFRKGSLLLAHSDGVGTHWDLNAYPGLAARPAPIVAAVLYRDFQRGRDDATFVAIRNPRP
jgi:anti-sigma regulatory factor (Ser/Thr protein kinase)